MNGEKNMSSCDNVRVRVLAGTFAGLLFCCGCQSLGDSSKRNDAVGRPSVDEAAEVGENLLHACFNIIPFFKLSGEQNRDSPDQEETETGICLRPVQS
jgi:hypothetical protein